MSTDENNIASLSADNGLNKPIPTAPSMREKLNKNLIAGKPASSEFNKIEEKTLTTNLDPLQQEVTQKLLRIPRLTIPQFGAQLARDRQLNFQQYLTVAASGTSGTAIKGKPGSSIQDAMQRLQIASTTGAYQFQRSVTLPYMRKSLALSYEHVAAMRTMVTLTTGMAQMLEGKLEAIKLNTAAPDIHKQSIFRQFHSALQQQIVKTASDKTIGGAKQLYKKIRSIPVVSDTIDTTKETARTVYKAAADSLFKGDYKKSTPFGFDAAAYNWARQPNKDAPADIQTNPNIFSSTPGPIPPTLPHEAPKPEVSTEPPKTSSFFHRSPNEARSDNGKTGCLSCCDDLIKRLDAIHKLLKSHFEKSEKYNKDKINPTSSEEKEREAPRAGSYAAHVAERKAHQQQNSTQNNYVPNSGNAANAAAAATGGGLGALLYGDIGSLAEEGLSSAFGATAGGLLSKLGKKALGGTGRLLKRGVVSGGRAIFGNKGLIGGALGLGEDALLHGGGEALAEEGAGLAGKVATPVLEEAGELAAKYGAKAVGGGLLKSLAKKIPLLGTIAGAGFAAKDLWDGDYLGALGDMSSGLVSNIPVFGTAASAMIDAAMLARNVYKSTNKESSALPPNQTTHTSNIPTVREPNIASMPSNNNRLAGNVDDSLLQKLIRARMKAYNFTEADINDKTISAITNMEKRFTLIMNQAQSYSTSVSDTTLCSSLVADLGLDMTDSDLLKFVTSWGTDVFDVVYKKYMVSLRQQGVTPDTITKLSSSQLTNVISDLDNINKQLASDKAPTLQSYLSYKKKVDQLYTTSMVGNSMPTNGIVSTDSASGWQDISNNNILAMQRDNQTSNTLDYASTSSFSTSGNSASNRRNSTSSIVPFPENNINAQSPSSANNNGMSLSPTKSTSSILPKSGSVSTSNMVVKTNSNSPVAQSNNITPQNIPVGTTKLSDGSLLGTSAQTITKARLEAYGFKLSGGIDEAAMIQSVFDLEDSYEESLHNRNSVDSIISAAISKLIDDIGLDSSDPIAVQYFKTWFNFRFVPLYQAYVRALGKVNATTDHISYLTVVQTNVVVRELSAAAQNTARTSGGAFVPTDIGFKAYLNSTTSGTVSPKSANTPSTINNTIPGTFSISGNNVRAQAAPSANNDNGDTSQTLTVSTLNANILSIGGVQARTAAASPSETGSVTGGTAAPSTLQQRVAFDTSAINNGIMRAGGQSVIPPSGGATGAPFPANDTTFATPTSFSTPSATPGLPSSTTGGTGVTTTPSGAVGVDQQKLLLRQAMDQLNVTDPSMRAGIAAISMGESGFKMSSEASYAHTSNDRIRSIFGSRVAGLSEDQLNSLKSDQAQFFNTVYGNSFGAKQLGNTKPGDGWNFRGRGLNQLTGRANYAKYGKMIGVDLESNPDLANDPAVAAKLAVAYMKDRYKGGGFEGMKRAVGAAVGSTEKVKDAAFAEYSKSGSFGAVPEVQTASATPSGAGAGSTQVAANTSGDSGGAETNSANSPTTSPPVIGSNVVVASNDSTSMIPSVETITSGALSNSNSTPTQTSSDTTEIPQQASISSTSPPSQVAANTVAPDNSDVIKALGSISSSIDAMHTTIASGKMMDGTNQLLQSHLEKPPSVIAPVIANNTVAAPKSGTNNDLSFDKQVQGAGGTSQAA